MVNLPAYNADASHMRVGHPIGRTSFMHAREIELSRIVIPGLFGLVDGSRGRRILREDEQRGGVEGLNIPGDCESAVQSLIVGTFSAEIGGNGAKDAPC
jgi:hypothetical protein